MIFIRKYMVSILIFVLGFCVCLPNAGAKSLTIATGEWVPYVSDNLENKGELTQKVTFILKKMGITPKYKFYPWKRCFNMVSTGKVWAAFPYSYTAKRAQSVWYSDMIGCSKTVFFYYEPKGEMKRYRFENLKDLKPYKIAGVLGYFYEASFKEAGLNVDYFYKEIEALKIIKHKNYDLMPLNKKVGENLIQTVFKKDAGQFKTLAKPLNITPLMLIVSKNYPDSKLLLDQFNIILKDSLQKDHITLEPCSR